MAPLRWRLLFQKRLFQCCYHLWWSWRSVNFSCWGGPGHCCGLPTTTWLLWWLTGWAVCFYMTKPKAFNLLSNSFQPWRDELRDLAEFRTDSIKVSEESERLQPVATKLKKLSRKLHSDWISLPLCIHLKRWCFGSLQKLYVCVTIINSGCEEGCLYVSSAITWFWISHSLYFVHTPRWCFCS